MKYLMFLDSTDIMNFKNQAENEGYTIELSCEGLYGHFMTVDTESKILTITDRIPEIEYSQVIDFEL